MAIQPFKIKEVEKELREGAERDANILFRDLRRDLQRTVRDLYFATVDFWNGQYHHGVFPQGDTAPPTAKNWVRPYPEVDIKINILDNWDVVISVRSTMIDENGKSHDLWYWLDRGVSFTQPTTSPPIPEQTEKRYPDNSLSSNRNAGYLDENYRVVQAGTEVKKEGKDWSNQIGEQIKSKFPEWRVNWRTN